MEYSLIDNIIWYLTFSNLLVLSWVTAYMYKNIKDKIFLFYTLYCIFMLLYAFTKSYDLELSYPHLLKTDWVQICHWYSQILFYSFLFFFSFEFLNLRKYYPKVLIFSKVVIIIGGIIGSLIAIYCLIAGNLILLITFFSYLYSPSLAVLGITIIIMALKVQGNGRLYFLIAMSIYTCFALLAFYRVNIFGIFNVIIPNTFFFIGVLIEGNIFAFALAKRIKELYQEKIRYQKELNIANERLNNQLLSEKGKLQMDFEKLELQKQIIDLEFNVINAQMNSHFMFNVLNSIKSYIIENDERTAVSYINQYGKFIRRILDVNRGSRHHLEDEVEIIKSYLQIEQLRLHNSFEYVITNKLPREMLQIPFPNLLLQPLVENAIWHGLMRANHNRKLVITFSQQGNAVQILIDDNGLGINKKNSARKKIQGATYTNTKGLQLVKERIEIYNKTKPYHISLELKDKKDFSDENGTLVKLILKNNNL